MTGTNTIHLAHSPDSDDAFMFYALADGQIDTQGISYVHELQDIETLNRRAMRGELDVTACRYTRTPICRRPTPCCLTEHRWATATGPSSWRSNR